MDLRQVIGPPGTGKTESMANWLAEQARSYGPNNLLVCSYTRTAAKEIRDRILARHGIDVPRPQIGTIHSLCYRALGAPALTVGLEAEFSRAFPQFALSGPKDKIETALGDPMADYLNDNGPGDLYRAGYDLRRAALKPRETWPRDIASFAEVWEDWKKQNDLMDFSDLLDAAYENLSTAPGDPAVGVLDEAQDSPANQLRVFLKWSRSMKKAIVAGDPDQTLYGWCGSSPQTMIEMDLPEGGRYVLSQSYRIPVAVHAIAERWIAGANYRLKREYLPRVDESGVPVPGSYDDLNVGFADPESMVRDAMTRFVPKGKSVMFLASCSYMLEPLKKHLKKEAIVFGNPWREQRADWNPMRPGDEKTNTAFRRLLAFLRPAAAFSGNSKNTWTWKDLYLWGDWIKAEMFWVRGAKKWLEERKESNHPFDPGEFIYFIRPEELEEFESLSFNTPGDRARALDWWQLRVAQSHAATSEYMVRVLKRYDAAALQKPSVYIGTAHSVKGGEADVVYLCPDLSKAGFGNWLARGETQDGVRRMLYVAMTRAKESLVLCRQDSNFSVHDTIARAIG